MAMSFNVKSVINNKTIENSQNPLLVSKMGINELVDHSCDLNIEETNIDNILRCKPKIKL